MIEVNSLHGRIQFGPFLFAWWNQEGDDPGWSILGYNDYNIELGQIDQDTPGIYVTEYRDGEVYRIKTLLQL